MSLTSATLDCLLPNNALQRPGAGALLAEARPRPHVLEGCRGRARSPSARR